MDILYQCTNNNKETIMFLSISRRTDIPSLYGDWLVNRFKAGYVYVRNPMNIHSVSKINLNSPGIDGIVFWTKNAINFIDHLDFFSSYPFYFQYTINPYSSDYETNIIKKEFIINNFIDISKKIGSDRIIWRYDPIFLNNSLTYAYHIKYFEYLCRKLSGFTKRCVFSFLDMYKKCERNVKDYFIESPRENQMIDLASAFASIARKYCISLETCGEVIDLNFLGIKHGKCIDDEIFTKITGYKYKSRKDKNQRSECGCIDSIDLGQYNSCINGCVYCYANYNKELAAYNFAKHNVLSPLLIGDVEINDKIRERKISTNRISLSENDKQGNLF